MVNEIESGQELNATQLDAQRARNLLDRALGLSERNDIAGAIVMCRQSLALAPNSPQGWSMLGLLSEQDSDIHGAIEAYEKTLQLSPGSTLERESLQRLRLKRGAIPRPAPKFQFDAISNGAPQVPSAQDSRPSIPAPLRTDPLTTDKPPSLWDTFYFRSLPVMLTAILCLTVITMAQRVAINRETQKLQNLPAIVETPSPSDMPEQSATPEITPDSLAPRAAPTQQDQNDSAISNEPVGQTTPAATAAPSTPAPVIAPARRPRPDAKPRPRPTPRAAAPTEMPVLPPPRLTLPKRSAPAPAIPKVLSDDNSSENQPTIGGGPVDVGNSQDSKYIPINPPQFPNASRQQR